jgi:hypothetical protein
MPRWKSTFSASTLYISWQVWEATFAIGKYACMQGWNTHLLFPEALPKQQHNLSTPHVGPEEK